LEVRTERAENGSDRTAIDEIDERKKSTKRTRLQNANVASLVYHASLLSSLFFFFRRGKEYIVAEYQTLIRLALASGGGKHGVRENWGFIYCASFDRIGTQAFRMTDREIRAWKIREPEWGEE